VFPIQDTTIIWNFVNFMVGWLARGQVFQSGSAKIMATVSIERQAGMVVLNPNPIRIGRTDVVVFVNNDTRASHQITQKGLAATAWMVDVLGPAVPGQDSFTSPGISFGDAIKGQDQVIEYACAVAGHTSETGQIIINAR
jgi:plastocyanin